MNHNNFSNEYFI